MHGRRRGWQTFLAIRFPYATPHIVAGLKVALTMAMIGVIVGEFVTAQQGLGYIIMFASSAAQTALMLAAIALLCVIGLVLYGIIVMAEALALKKLWSLIDELNQPGHRPVTRLGCGDDHGRTGEPHRWAAGRPRR